MTILYAYIVIVVLFFVVGIYRPSWFSKHIPILRQRLYDAYKNSLIVLETKKTLSKNGYTKVKGTPVNFSRNKSNIVEDEEGSLSNDENEQISYTYGQGCISPDTIIIEEPPSSISSIKSTDSDVPSPSLHSLPSIVAVLQAKGKERLHLLDTRRRRLRKIKS